MDNVAADTWDMSGNDTNMAETNTTIGLPKGVRNRVGHSAVSSIQCLKAQQLNRVHSTGSVSRNTGR